MDRAIYLAHAEIAEKSGKISYAASARELAELANCSHVTASISTKRLLTQELLELSAPAIATYSNRYQLVEQPIEHNIAKDTSAKTYIVHDAFCYQGMGKSAALIWEALNEIPMTIDELVAKTGKTRPTVKKWLAYMQNQIVNHVTGEIVQMLQEEDDLWRPVDNIDLDYVAQLLNVSGNGENRKRNHRIQRDMHSRGLRHGQTNSRQMINDLGK